MDHNIPLADFPSCAALQIRAECLGGIHLLCDCLHMHSLQMSLAVEKGMNRSFWEVSMVSFDAFEPKPSTEEPI